MNIKRKLWIILSLLIALSLIAAGSAAARTVYIKGGVSKDLQVGKMGAHVTKSQYAGYLTVSPRTKQPVTGTNRLALLEKMIDVRFKDTNGQTVTYIQGAWYVFYNLSPKQMKLFDEQKIAIFYFDPWPGKWKQCNTWKVYNTPNRVGCRIIYFGLYGLGYRN